MILVYHHVAPRAPEKALADEGWSWLHTPRQLECHITELRRRGRRIISLGEYVDHGAPRNSVVLTFDDGWADNYEFAVPILRSHAVPATFFVTTDHIYGDRPDSRRIAPDQLKRLDRAGFTIGGHTQTHRALTLLDREGLEREVVGCRDDLKRLLGHSSRWFAYPGGAFDRRSVEAVRSAGWDGAVSSLGPARNTLGSRYWMFREVPGTDLRSRRDRARLSPVARRLWALRTSRRLRRRLRAG